MANRYWVGGSGTWNTTSTTNWSASSGGASGASVPTAADAVFFDQASTYTVTMTGALLCLDLTVSAGTVTFATGTTPTLAVSGSISVIAATVWNSTGTITFNATTSKTITSNGVSFASPLTFNGVAGTWALQDNLTTSALVTLTNGTLNVNSKILSCGSFSSSNSNVRTLAFGTGSISLTRNAVTIWTTNTVTNLTVSGTPVVNITYSGASSCTVSPGNLAESMAISFNAIAGTYPLSLMNGAGDTVKNINLTGYSGTVTFLNNSPQTGVFYGNVTISSGCTVAFDTGAGFSFSATSGTQLLTTAGKGFPRINRNGAGGTLQLQDNLTCTNTLTSFSLSNGTLDLNGKTLTLVNGDFITAAGTKNLTFNGGTIIASNNGTSAWNNAAPTGFTTTAGTGTGKISMTSALSKTFVGGGSTYNCTLSNDGAGALTITGSNTFTTIANGVRPTTFTFTSGTTQTITNWSVSGTAGNLVTIGASTTSAATISKSSGAVVADYLSISYSTVTGGAAWYAGSNSANNGNNTGWFFTSGNINATSATFDGQDINNAAIYGFAVYPAVWDLGIWDFALWDGNIASSSTTDGADLNSALTSLISIAYSATNDGADVNAANALINSNATSNTIDGADISNATILLGIDATSNTTDGSDISYAIANNGQIVVIDTHDGDHQKKRFQKEVSDKERRKRQIIDLYEELVELKPKVAEKVIAPFVQNDVQSQNLKIDFTTLLENLGRTEALYNSLQRELQEIDDEEVLILL